MGVDVVRHGVLLEGSEYLHVSCGRAWACMGENVVRHGVLLEGDATPATHACSVINCGRAPVGRYRQTQLAPMKP